MRLTVPFTFLCSAAIHGSSPPGTQNPEQSPSILTAQYPDLSTISSVSWRSTVARIIDGRFRDHELPLSDVWGRVHGAEAMVVALNTADTDHVVSMVFLIGELLSEASCTGVTFRKPDGSAHLCGYLDRVYTSHLASEYASRVRDDRRERRKFAFEYDTEHVLYATPLANAHLVCTNLRLGSLQATVSDRVLRHIASNREKWPVTDNFS